MNRFWGRNDNEKISFSRDNDQMLALNYENTCDGEYLNRLFHNNSNASKDHRIIANVSGAVDSSSVSNIASTNNTNDGNNSSANDSPNNVTATNAYDAYCSNTSVLLNHDVSEDIIIFSSERALGIENLHKRFIQTDMSSLGKYQDALSLSLDRQIIVFDYIGELMLERCSRDSSITTKNTTNISTFDSIKNDKDPFSSKHNLVSESLLCMLKSIEKQSIVNLKQPVIEQVLSVFVRQFQQQSELDVLPKTAIDYGGDKPIKNSAGNFPLSLEHVHAFRQTLINGTLQAVNNASKIDLSNINQSQLKEVEDNFKLALTCSYGLLALGVYLKSVGDLIITISHLVMIANLGEEIQERFTPIATKNDSIGAGLAINLNSSNGSTNMSMNNTPPINIHTNPKFKMRMKGYSSDSSKMLKQLLPRNPATNSVLATPNTLVPDGVREEDVTNLSHPIQKWDKASSLPIKVLPGGTPGGTPAVIEKDSKSKINFIKCRHDSDELHKPVVPAQSSNNVMMNLIKITDTVGNNKQLSKSMTKASHGDDDSYTLPDGNAMKSSASKKRDTRDVRSKINSLLRIPKSILSIVQDCNLSLNSINTSRVPIDGKNPTSRIVRSYVWSCGQNSYGELGHGDITHRRSFSKISTLKDKCIVSIGAGNEHSVFVTKDGKVLVSGYNDNGQCGVGSTQQVKAPMLVQALDGEDVVQAHVYNGCEHTLAVTRDGKLYSFGYNSRGQLGLGTTSLETVPRPVKGLLSRKIILAACSYHHSMMICSDGVLLACGRNDCGQLGHNDTIDKKAPHPVANAPRNMQSISCGQFHTVVSTSTGAVYVCGKNDWGQLGLESTANVKVLTQLIGSSEVENIKQVCCGYYHTLLLSHYGAVIGFGRNDYGQLGLGHAQPRTHGFHLLTALRDKNVTLVAAGCYHSIAATYNGMLYVFGRNNHGQLGSGDLEEKHAPHPVDDFVGKRIVSIASGFYHTIVLATDPIAADEASDQAQANALFSSLKSSVGETLTGNRTSVTNSSTTIAVEDTKNSHPSSRGCFSMDLRSKITVSKLLSHLIGQVDSMVKCSLESKHCERSRSTSEKYSDNLWVIRLVHAVAEMMVLLKNYLCDTHGYVELQFSIEDSYTYLGSLVGMAESLLQNERQLLTTSATESAADIDDLFPLSVGINSDTYINESSRAIDILNSIHSSVNAFECQADTADSDTHDRTIGIQKLAHAAICKLRKGLVCLYTAIPPTAVHNESGINIAQDCANCISKYYEVLFPSIGGRERFFYLLKVRLLQMQSIDSQQDEFQIDSRDLNHVFSMQRCLRLFTHICFKYRGMNEIVKLFKSSMHHALVIFESMLCVYNHLSILSLDSKLQVQFCRPGGDLSQALYALEHCNSNFVKCAVPAIFNLLLQEEATADQQTVDDNIQLGFTIIDHVFASADYIISLLAKQQQQQAADVISILRCGTVIPSILPTILLFGTSHASKCDRSICYLLPRVTSLIDKLKLCVDGTRRNAVEPKDEADVCISSMCYESPASTDPHTAGKHSSVVPWWSRLFRLALILKSKLATSLMMNSVRTLPTVPATSSTTYHAIWRWISRPEAGDSIDGTNTSNNAVGSTDLSTSLRVRYCIIDHTYRALNHVSKASKTIALMEDVENMIFHTFTYITYGSMTVPHFNYSNAYTECMWKEIVAFSKLIQSKKSSLVELHAGATWQRILLAIRNAVQRHYEQLTSCTRRIAFSQLINLSRRSNSSRAKTSFRLCVLQIICVIRWKKCCVDKFLTIPKSIISYYTHALHAEILKLTFDAGTVDSTVNVSCVCIMDDGLEVINSYTQGLNILRVLMAEAPYVSVKSDIVTMMLTVFNSTVYIAGEVQRCSILIQRWCEGHYCTSISAREQLVDAYKMLVLQVYAMIHNFIIKFPTSALATQCSTSELNLLCLCLKFFHLLNVNSCIYSYCLPPKIVHDIFVVLDDKPYTEIAFDDKVVDQQTSLTAASATTASTNNNSPQVNAAPLSIPSTQKKLSTRERVKSLRRATNTIVSLLQAIVIHEGSLRFNRYNVVFTCNLLHVHCDLILSLQRSSINAQRSELVDSTVQTPGKGLGITSSTVQESKDTNTPSAGSSSSSKEGKKRCQDVISKPMEFCRSQEGFVVQGDKLLNNYKGIDFTLVTWILITGKSNGRQSFITGKVSHNDAWPLVTLRLDHKLEVIFGHGNDFERMTSQESLASSTWIQIAVVVEPKKIKLFINGVLDSQIVTKGNARAILYPIIIGTCPTGVRTRVEHVRDGFDGFLASYKYYTRALSPIHVRVVFDQGAPESYDIREKWIYQLLASTSSLIDACCKYDNSDSMLSKAADTLLYVFMTDTGNRMRCGSLALLSDILSREALTDMAFLSSSIASDEVVSIIACPFLSMFDSFEEKMVLYMLYLIGSCWMPSFTAAAADIKDSSGINSTNVFSVSSASDTSNGNCVDSSTSNGNDGSYFTSEIIEFLPYIPTFLCTTHSKPLLGSLIHAENADMQREKRAGELCYHLVNILRKLSVKGKWHIAITYVIGRLLTSINDYLSSRSVSSQVTTMSMLGIGVFMAEYVSGPYVGTTVHTYYGDAEGCVLNINETTQLATILSWNNAGSKRQLSTVKIADLAGTTVASRFSISPSLIRLIVHTMDALRPYIDLSLNDIFSLYRPDDAFTRSTLLKLVRPVEVFFYHKLLKCLSKHKQHDYVAKAAIEAAIQDKPELFSVIQDSAYRVIRTHTTEDVDKTTSGIWSRCCHYLHFASIQVSVPVKDFPSADMYKTYIEYLSKYLGISLESLQETQHQHAISRCILSELLLNVAVNSGHSDPGDAATATIVVNDVGARGYFDINDAETLIILRLMHNLRRDIVVCSRTLMGNFNMLTQDTLPLIPLHKKLLLWQTLCSNNSVFTTGQPEGTDAVVMLRMDLKQQYDSVSHALAASLRFGAISLLNTNACKTVGNIIEVTDLYRRILDAAHLWIHSDGGCDTDTCISFLKVLLPSLSFVESVDLELRLIQLCQQLVHKLCFNKFNGFKPSKGLLELAKSNTFTLVRARAQEQLSRQKGNMYVGVNPLVQSLVQLSAGLEIIQRSTFCTTEVLVSNSDTGILMALEKLKTLPPKVVACTSTSVDIDLYPCVSIGEFNAVDVDCIGVEVALGVVVDGEETIFETIYCGNSLKFIQSGLMASCAYSVKCRAVVTDIRLEWSSAVVFRTDTGFLFTFDSTNCGSDILISDDGLTASYAGDDSWSTLLGTQSFTSGVTSWDIRITQSSTAYIFIGVAAAAADLNTFLGGCGAGWGFIGEQALYHNREKVKVYGESFSAGDVIGVTLDLCLGTLSFTKNGKVLGIAFDKLYGELYPAVAFYNVGQELEILTDSFTATIPHQLVPCSPYQHNIDEVGTITEIMFCFYHRSSFPLRLLQIITDHCNEWCRGDTSREKAASGKSIILSKSSELLTRYHLHIGERVRTPYGISEVAGTAFNRVWFRGNDLGSLWFFSHQQIVNGKEKGLFLRCTYELDDSISSQPSDASISHHVPGSVQWSSSSMYDTTSMRDLLEPGKWTDEMDAILVSFLIKQGSICGTSPWNVSADHVHHEFRLVQQQLSRIVLSTSTLSQHWGVGGPKRRAVVARISFLRLFNHMLDHYLPLLRVSDSITHIDDGLLHSYSQGKRANDDFNPTIMTVDSDAIEAHDATSYQPVSSNASNKVAHVIALISMSWDVPEYSARVGTLPATRHRIFTELKAVHFWEMVHRSAARPAKTEDDYDYPEDLPQVRINRLKSFRAKEASGLLNIPGEDLLLSSIFTQLWKELRMHSSEKLRISYTHPMDDGQSRTFKIKFDGEGVDDYGGPYREIFQQICEELQSLDDAVSTGKAPSSWSDGSDKQEDIRSKCFLPLLHVTPNWTAGECTEKYKYMFNPSSTSLLRMDLYKFLGQIVGIAIRSKITLDLNFPSFIWKMVVKEKLTELDIASFDKPASDYVQHLGSIHHRIFNTCDSSNDDDAARAALLDEATSLLQDISWTATRSDGRLVELVPGGCKISVTLDTLSAYLKAYTVCRLSENIESVDAFREGIISVIPETSIALFCWDELQHIVCGARTIDLGRLEDNTEYDDDVSADDRHIVIFWEVLKGFTEAEKSMFLRFVWARPTLPPSGVEFPQKFKIQSAVGDDAVTKPDTYLPKAHTCFFSINLPRYSCKEVAAERLRYAISHCTEMDADFRVNETDVQGWFM